MPHYFSVLRTALLPVVAFLAGCSESDPLVRQAISGQVTLDGSPIAYGNISFDPDGPGATTSSGSVVKDGEFAIDKSLGLPAGRYRVRINIPEGGPDTGIDDTTTMPGEAPPPPAELAPPEWNRKSTQSVEVSADGANHFQFDITSQK